MLITNKNYKVNKNKSEDRIKDKNRITLNEAEKEKITFDNKRSLDAKKNHHKIKVVQNEKKVNKENLKISKINKDNLEKNLNEENKENIDKNKNKENEENKENKENKEHKKNKENNEIKKNNESKENNENKENKEVEEKEKDKDEDDVKVKYFDATKINNVQIPKDYINIIYYNLLKEEKEGIEPKAEYNYMNKQKEINDKMRSILIDWIIDVHFKFGFTDETLFMTVSIIDRYLTISQITRTNFQLLGITALMIACKHEEIDLPKIDDFIYITDNAYVKNEVIKMENDVLSKLNFSFLYPSPIKFFEYLSFHFNFDKKQHMMGKYLMETFLLDVKNTKYKPSIISCACAYIVMKFFKMSDYHESYNKRFYNLDENLNEFSQSNIKECAKDICLLIDNINKTNYHACLKKYSKPEQEKVAIIIMNN